jgi:hypothetical protein
MHRLHHEQGLNDAYFMILKVIHSTFLLFFRPHRIYYPFDKVGLTLSKGCQGGRFG